ncbi:unnamed protein product [Pedinophyceae sp. YPF-701]|nr:unnamed protein product [Pedinophyceae sp. YPF-701]
MGKKRAAKDRLHLSATEWRETYGGFKGKANLPYRNLPFYCCALSFSPFEDAVCAPDGTCFDIVNIVPYVNKFGKHPVSGEPLALKDLTRLTWHKNGDGEYACPVTGKVFTEHTHIAAVKPSGNVYCWTALDELNIKAKNWRDLISDEPFKRSDIIHLQDPAKLRAQTLDQFDHVKNDLTAGEGVSEDKAAGVNLGAASDDLKRMMGDLGKREEDAAKKAAARDAARATLDAAGRPRGGPQDPRLRAPEREDVVLRKKPGALTWDTDERAGTAAKRAGESKLQALLREKKPGLHKMEPAKHSTGSMARGFTSTAFTGSTKVEREMVRVQRRPRKKGYLRIMTNLGDLNVELHADIVPKTCENFMALAEVGFYDNCVFHRSIRNFMIQGGDPTGTGTGGESIFGETFEDEFDLRLTHDGRGVLSMANSGPDTNGSQFFILYKSAPHLDNKHTVFGKVVGGMETLTAMERVETDNDDKPKRTIRIVGCEIFVDPFKELDEEEEKRARDKAAKDNLARTDKRGAWFSNPGQANAPAAAGGGVGRYLPKAGTGAVGAGPVADIPTGPAPAKKKQKTGGYGNFDAFG